MLAQRYGGYPWAIGGEPAARVMRHLWLMSYSEQTSAGAMESSEDDAMLMLIADRAEVA